MRVSRAWRWGLAGLLALGGVGRAAQAGADPCTASASRERRVALVVGNTAYRATEAPPLPGAVRDAGAIAEFLQGAGFTEVLLRTDLGRAGFRAAVESLRAALEGGGVGVFYYAGHAFQYDGRNYLLPVDAVLPRVVSERPTGGELRSLEAAIHEQTVDATEILRVLEASPTRVNVALLDACQGNPFARRVPAPDGSVGRAWRWAGREVVPGLAAMDLALNKSIVAYATAPGSVATDEGTFARAVVAELARPNVEVGKALQAAKERVVTETDHHQSPYYLNGRGEARDLYLRWVDPRTQMAARPVQDGGVQGLGDELVVVEGSTFQMGSSTAEGRPPHEVRVCTYALGRTEVTQGLYELVTGGNPTPQDHQGQPLRGARMPVTGVSWCDAVKFANLLSVRGGFREAYSGVTDCVPTGGGSVRRMPGADGYRLPSEAEWEFAVRAGVAGAPPWSISPAAACDAGNVRDRPGGAGVVGPFPCADRYAAVAPAASFGVNPLGLYDLLGNVSEWVGDRYSALGAATQTDPQGADWGADSVFRGSSWYSNQLARDPGAASADSPTRGRFDRGFRLAATPSRAP